MISFLTIRGIGDLAGVVGVVISVIGFLVTVIAVLKSKTAAEQAEDAATDALESVRLFDTIVDFSAGIATLEEIKRLHRLPDAKPLLPDRYNTIRKTLIQMRNSNVQMTPSQSAIIQNALVNLSDIEKRLEKSFADPAVFKPAKLNAIISEDVDGLLAVLTQLKTQANGGSL